MNDIPSSRVDNAVIEALSLFVQATEHLQLTLSRAVLAAAIDDHGPGVQRVVASADETEFSVTVYTSSGEIFERVDPDAELVVTCGVFLSVLGDGGAFAVEMGDPDPVVTVGHLA